MTEKLVRRHPHVFGDGGDGDRRPCRPRPRHAGQVRENWDAIKRTESPQGRSARRRAGDAARADVRAQASAPRSRRQRPRRSRARRSTELRARPRANAAQASRRGGRRTRRPRSRRATAPSASTTRSASCCSRRWSWRARSRSIPEIALERATSGSAPAERGRMSAIERVHARQILDSRGNPDRRGRGLAALGRTGRAAVPSGASTGEFEAVELRDGGERLGRQGRRDGGRRRQRRDRQARWSGLDASDQQALDRALIELDGTPNKARLGANAILGVSLAAAKAAADEAGPAALPLPRRRGRPRAARADDERAQRRRARRQPARLPGVHDRAGRRGSASRRRCGWASRSSTR